MKQAVRVLVKIGEGSYEYVYLTHTGPMPANQATVRDATPEEIAEWEVSCGPIIGRAIPHIGTYR